MPCLSLQFCQVCFYKQFFYVNNRLFSHNLYTNTCFARQMFVLSRPVSNWFSITYYTKQFRLLVGRHVSSQEICAVCSCRLSPRGSNKTWPEWGMGECATTFGSTHKYELWPALWCHLDFASRWGAEFFGTSRNFNNFVNGGSLLMLPLQKFWTYTFGCLNCIPLV